MLSEVYVIKMRFVQSGGTAEASERERWSIGGQVPAGGGATGPTNQSQVRLL